MIKQPHYIGLEEARQLLTQMGQPAGGFAASVRFSRSEPSSLLTRRWRRQSGANSSLGGQNSLLAGKIQGISSTLAWVA